MQPSGQADQCAQFGSNGLNSGCSMTDQGSNLRRSLRFLRHASKPNMLGPLICEILDVLEKIAKGVWLGAQRLDT